MYSEKTESDGWDDGWTDAEDDGQDREEWILGRNNDSHPDLPGRDVGGRFNRHL